MRVRDTWTVDKLLTDPDPQQFKDSQILALYEATISLDYHLLCFFLPRVEPMTSPFNTTGTKSRTRPSIFKNNMNTNNIGLNLL